MQRDLATPAAPSPARAEPLEGSSRRAMFSARRLRWDRTDWLLLLIVSAIGAVLRFYQLGVTPPGFQFDEAFNAIDAVQVLDGNRPLFLPANGGREVLFTYFQAGLIALFGESVWSFRLASALWGTAGVAATFTLFRTVLRRESRLVASCGALALAISYWHIHYSHFGIRVITMPVLFSVLFGVYWSATQAPTARRRIWLYLLAGAVLGISVYSNPTGRLAPLVLIAYTVALLWLHPDERRLGWSRPLGGLFLAGGAALVVFLPLGITFLRHPEFFLGHASEVSVFAERVSGDSSVLQAIATNALHVAGMFNFYGDLEWTHGIAGRPVLDWALALPFVLGAGVWAARLVGRGRRDDEDLDALWLLFFWAVVMLAPSIFSDAAPNTSRTLPSLPAAYLPLAFGLAWIIWLPQHPKDAPVRSLWPRRWMGYALVGLLLVTSAIITVNDYFVRYPAMREVYIAYDVEKLDALNNLGERARTSTVYLSPLWANHATVRYLRSRFGIRSLDATQAVVLPPGKDAVYAFTNEEQARAERFAAQWPDLEVEMVPDRDGHPMLFVVTVPATGDDEWLPMTQPGQAYESLFIDAPTFLGIDQVEGGRLNLFWRSEAPTYRNLTTFVHMINADGERVAQVDRIPGDGSFQTPSWRPGERVVDHAVPVYLEPCAGGEEVQVLAGWYEWAADNARRPRLDAPGEVASAGVITLPVRPYLYAVTADGDPAEGAPRPAVERVADMGDATLIGYTMQHADYRPGGALVLDLFLRADVPLDALPASLDLQGPDQSLPLADASIVAERTLGAGDEVCRRVRLRLPAASTGEWTLTLNAGMGRIALEQIVVESQSEAEPPPSEYPSGARFENGLTLLGATVEPRAEGVLPVELVWQAGEVPHWPVTAFVQLLGADGIVIAQSDSAPGTTPVPRWAAGDVVLDLHTLALPEPLPVGPLRLVAGLYEPITFERLTVVGGDGVPLPDNAVVIAEFDGLD